jgi:hypothetical protein
MYYFHYFGRRCGVDEIYRRQWLYFLHLAFYIQVLNQIRHYYEIKYANWNVHMTFSVHDAFLVWSSSGTLIFKKILFKCIIYTYKCVPFHKFWFDLWELNRRLRSRLSYLSDMSIEALISVFSMYQWYLWHTFGTMHVHTFYVNIPHSSGSKCMRDGRFHKPPLF